MPLKVQNLTTNKLTLYSLTALKVGQNRLPPKIIDLSLIITFYA